MKYKSIVQERLHYNLVSEVNQQVNYIFEKEKEVSKRRDTGKNKALFKQSDLRNAEWSIGQFYTLIMTPVINRFTTELKRKISEYLK